MTIPEIGAAEALSARAEQQGWDGITFTDSQNLVGDPFVAIALGASATEQLQFATGVTNAFTRHPAALANIAATVQETSGGRFVLGIGRGDTALFHLGRKPMPVADFAAAVVDLQAYLANETVDCSGRPSRLRFLDRCTQPKVPLDVAVSGPRMIELAAEVAERVTLAVGADPDRVAWALDLARQRAADVGRDPAEISFGAYVNVGCHPDLDAARGLIGGAVAAFAHFSSMPGSTGGGLRDSDRGSGGRSRPPLRQQRAPEQRGRPHAPARGRLRRSVRGRRAARRVCRPPAQPGGAGHRSLRHHRPGLPRRPRPRPHGRSARRR